MGTLANDLAARLPPRLGRLCRSVKDFVAEGEVELAAQMWAHLKDAIACENSRDAPHV